MRHGLSHLVGSLLAALVALGLLSVSVGPVPPIGDFLDPWSGVYRTARLTVPPGYRQIELPALEATVSVVRDSRWVPHIYAESDEDAIRALGYVSAEDRLFQMDFLRRVSSGRLSEILGEGGLRTDRFMRGTGMRLGVERTSLRIRTENDETLRLLHAFHDGVNAYISTLSKADLPLEYRLLGISPVPFEFEDTLWLLQFMSFDLTFRTDDPAYGALLSLLGEVEFSKLYPRHSTAPVPMVHLTPDVSPANRGTPLGSGGLSDLTGVARARPELAEGYVDGKGSNAWVVGGNRSRSGRPLLAGDVHLSLTLPALWYEIHLVTPTMNVYGVTVPGAPLPIIGFNTDVAWTFTNSGGDQIDFYFLRVDSSRTRYGHADGWLAFDARTDTIQVRDRDPVVDTLLYTRWGPADLLGDGAMAFEWTAHKSTRTVDALLKLVRSKSARELEDALRLWDTPLQNVLYADADGNIGGRVVGMVPIRRAGHGIGVASDPEGSGAWVGYIPFDEMPASENPPGGYLLNSNQEPVGKEYPYYLGYDWIDSFRAQRVRWLLDARQRHGAADFMRYQADVQVIQKRSYDVLLDTLSGLSERASAVRDLLVGWDGWADTAATGPLIFDEFLYVLPRLVWDEPVFDGEAAVPERVTGVTIANMRHGRTVRGRIPPPSGQVLIDLLTDEQSSRWFDRVDTPGRERADDILRRAMEQTADTLAARYGLDPAGWRWGDHHQIAFPHITRSSALAALWRGPFPHPGFANTVSPAGDRLTTHSAAWRMIVDFETRPPTAYGIYPGGQSGDPFSAYYDAHMQRYLSFEYNRLLTPATPADLDPGEVAGQIRFVPSEPASNRSRR